MTLHYELTEEDAVAAVLHSRRQGMHKAASPRLWRAFLMPAAIPLLLVIGMEITKGPSPLDLLVFTGLFVVIALSFVALVTLLNRFVFGIGNTSAAMERSARQLLKVGFLRANMTPTTAEVLEDAICFRSQYGESLAYLDSIHSVQVDDGYVWLMRFKDAVGQIPLRAFSSETHLQEFLAAVRRHDPAAPPTRPFADLRKAKIQPA